MQGTMPGARRRGRPRTAWMDNIKTWTGLPVEESIRMTEDRDKWRKYVHCAWPTRGWRTTKDQGPDLQNILRQSYDYLTIMPTLRSIYDGRLIYETSYEERESFLGYNIVRSSEIVFAN